MDADHQKSAFASKRGVPKCPFGELYVLHFQTDDFFKTKSCGKQDWVAFYRSFVNQICPVLRYYVKLDEIS
jgi:hypothetical protein